MEKPNKYYSIPDPSLDYVEISKQLYVNCEIIKKEISDHVNKEIERLKREICEMEKNI